MSLSLNKLDKDDITILKGIGIILIVFHNFFHIISGIQENQLNFDFDNTIGFLDSILNNPLALFNNFLSFFGHHGVLIFIFCSAYGLTKKYLNNPAVKYKDYIIPRIIKLYSLFLFGIIAYLLFLGFKGELNFFPDIKMSLVKMLLVDNFSYNTIFRYVGPWWFFSLIMQFYLLFPFLFRFIDKYNKKGFFILLIGSYILIYILFPLTERYDIPLFGNFIGHLPEFILGIAFAFFDKLKISYKQLLGVFIIFLLSNFSSYMFPFSFLSVTIIILFFSLKLINLSKEKINSFLLFIGKISMIMFVINAPFREISYLVLTYYDSPLFTALISFLHFTLVAVVSFAMKKIYDKTFQPLSNKLTNFLLKL